MSSPEIFVHNAGLKLIDFLSGNSEGKTVAQVKNEIQQFYNCYNFIVMNLGNCPVFRVRKIEPNDEHNKVQNVWCPRNTSVKYLGRANDIGQSVFYGALNYKTAIHEAKISPGDKYSLACYFLTSHKNDDKTSIVIKQSKPLYDANNEIDLFGVELSKFMVNEFTKDVHKNNEHQYIRSCAIAQILWEVPHKDSLIYPSVKKDNSINIAMKEVDARNRLRLDLVLTCQCLSMEQHSVLEVKSPNNNDLLIKHDYTKSPVPLQTDAPDIPWLQIDTTYANYYTNLKRSLLSYE